MKIRYPFYLLVLSLIACGTQPSESSEDDEEMVWKHDMYIGTYTQKEGHVDGKAEGVYRIHAGGTSPTTVAKGIVNPSYVHHAEESNLLFAVSETGGADTNGRLYMYRVENDGNLTLLHQADSHGDYPCHVTASANGTRVFLANYGGGVTAYLVEGDSLKFQEVVRFEGKSDHPRQEASHPHMVLLSQDESQLYVSDLGANKIWIFDINDDGIIPATQRVIEAARHAGPRHMAWNPANGHLYVINELDNTISTFTRDSESGQLTQKQSLSTLPDNFEEFNKNAAVKVHPNGKFVYASNRGHNSIAHYAVMENGDLSLVGHVPTGGDAPRDFALSSNGEVLYVANQNTDNIMAFQIDHTTGSLSEIGQMQVKTPVCIAF